MNSGSFNGVLGSVYSPGLNVQTYEIYWTNSKVYFVVNGDVLHTVSASSSTWSNTMSFYVFTDNINSGTVANNVILNMRSGTIYRLGQPITTPTHYYHANGTQTGINLKLGLGTLQRIIFQSANNAIITLSDSTTTTTPVIWASTGAAAVSQPALLDFGGIPFYNGLRLTVSGGNAQATITYE